MEIDYNKDLDILTVEEGDYSDYTESVERGGFVLNFNSVSGFLGIEILDASQKTGRTREELDTIRDAEVDVERGEDFVNFTLTLQLEDGKDTITDRYPTPAIA